MQCLTTKLNFISKMKVISVPQGAYNELNLLVLIKKLNGQTDDLIISNDSLIFICHFSSVLIRTISS